MSFSLGLQNLHELDLRANYIEIIRHAGFSPLKSLTRLILKSNRVSVIQSDPWQGLHNLAHLDLDDYKNIMKTKVSTLKKLLNFSTMNHLVHLNLRKIGLKQKHLGHWVFKNLPKNLSFLSLYQNFPLINLTGHLFIEVKYLKELVLTDCKIEYVPAGTFLQQTHLRILRMNYNKLVTITTGMWFGLSRLTELHLARNTIKYLKGRVYY